MAIIKCQDDLEEDAVVQVALASTAVGQLPPGAQQQQLRLAPLALPGPA